MQDMDITGIIYIQLLQDRAQVKKRPSEKLDHSRSARAQNTFQPIFVVDTRVTTSTNRLKRKSPDILACFL